MKKVLMSLSDKKMAIVFKAMSKSGMTYAEAIERTRKIFYQLKQKEEK